MLTLSKLTAERLRISPSAWPVEATSTDTYLGKAESPSGPSILEEIHAHVRGSTCYPVPPTVRNKAPSTRR